MIVSFIGPTGTGKTTLANAMLEYFDATIIKIASPIYEMQKYFYGRLGLSISSQDGELLQYLANKIERESPGWLAREFLAEVGNHERHLIINDDCRLNAYRYLKGKGIVFVRVVTTSAERKMRLRKDHVRLDVHHETEEGLETILCPYEINNNGTVENSIIKAVELLKDIIGGQDTENDFIKGVRG